MTQNGSTGDRRREEVLGIRLQQGHCACRCDDREGVGKIVHFVKCTSVQAGTLQAVFNYLAKGRCGLRRFDEWLTFDLAQSDDIARGTREDHDEWFCAHQLVNQVACVWLGS